MRRAWTRAAIALGSNLGERTAHLEAAVREIGALPGTRVLSVSRWIETEPVGGPAGSPRFLNGVAIVETRLPARALLEALLAIERAHGRERRPEVPGAPSALAAPRTLDLDLLTFGDRSIDEPGLRVPHPRMEERVFVLAPLAEVAPDLRLASGRPVAGRLADLAR